MVGKEELKAVKRVIKSRNLSGYKGSISGFYGGPEIHALEKIWAKYFEVKHAIACNSATSGLWMACQAIGLKAGDEVIVTPWSMTCSASMPLLFGAIPVFADIEPDYYCLDPKSVEEKITEKTKAIIIVDLFGMPYDADAINRLARKHNIVVIEDAAQAAGAKYKDYYAGTLGDIGVYSLNVHKHIQCGEGGIVVTDDDVMAHRLRLAMNHGEAVENDISGPYQNIAGMNLRMTELSAAVAREQLKKLEKIIKVYQQYANYFNIPVREGCTSAYYKFASKTTKWNPEPALFNFKEHYIKPIYLMPLFESLGYKEGLCPRCEFLDKVIKISWFKEVI